MTTFLAPKYRVAHLVEDNFLLTLRKELHFSIWNLYRGGTFNLMSTNSIPRPDGPPCIWHWLSTAKGAYTGTSLPSASIRLFRTVGGKDERRKDKTTDIGRSVLFILRHSSKKAPKP